MKRSSLATSRLIQIVDLQPDRRRAGAFEAVENSDDVRIGHRAWRFDEDSFFHAHVVRQVGAIAKVISIDVILNPLLKQISERTTDLARIIHGTHVSEAV